MARAMNPARPTRVDLEQTVLLPGGCAPGT
jgi:hypothetical protein